MGTALVFDIYQLENDLCLLLLMNKHFKFKKNELIRALQYDINNECALVELFTKNNVKIFSQGRTKDEDFVIYQLFLDTKKWELLEPDTILSTPQKQKSRTAASNQMKVAEIICKTPRYSYHIQQSMPVYVFGFPHTSLGRWVGTATITSMERNTFGLQMLSALGLSGGAVVTTQFGEVVGIRGGNHEADKDGKPQLSYTIIAREFPIRPSSQPSCPDDGKKKAKRLKRNT